jgi:molecular chaperone HscB
LAFLCSSLRTSHQLDAEELQREAIEQVCRAEQKRTQRWPCNGLSVGLIRAYQRLKIHLSARELFVQAADAPINAETMAMPSDFLMMQQMEWREALEDAQSVV